MKKKKEGKIEIVPLRDQLEITNKKWIAEKSETIESCVLKIRQIYSDSIQINNIKRLSLKELREIKEQHGNIKLERFMKMKFCTDCESWKDYKCFYQKTAIRKRIKVKVCCTYCIDCYKIRNKVVHKKFYAKPKNRETKRIYREKMREKRKKAR